MCQKHDRKGVPGRRRRCRPPFLPLARSAKNLLLPPPLRPSFSSDRRYWAKRGLSLPLHSYPIPVLLSHPLLLLLSDKVGRESGGGGRGGPTLHYSHSAEDRSKAGEGFSCPPLVLKCCDNAHPFLLPYSPNDPTSFAMAGGPSRDTAERFFKTQSSSCLPFPHISDSPLRGRVGLPILLLGDDGAAARQDPAQ